MVQDTLKPSRSDLEELSAEEREAVEQQVKDFLKSNTPVRALKPSRSETEELLKGTESIPQGELSKAEFEKFQALEAGNNRINTEGGVVNDDSYVATEYYDDLNAVDKTAHHETGTGFIKIDRSEPWHLNEDVNNDSMFKTATRTNPATNEWEPAKPVDIAAESKVRRSDP